MVFSLNICLAWVFVYTIFKCLIMFYMFIQHDTLPLAVGKGLILISYEPLSYPKTLKFFIQGSLNIAFLWIIVIVILYKPTDGLYCQKLYFLNKQIYANKNSLKRKSCSEQKMNSMVLDEFNVKENFSRIFKAKSMNGD